MADYIEIDFHEVHTKKSGDAITIRYEQDGLEYIYVVDGGYSSTGKDLVEHINNYYGRVTNVLALKAEAPPKTPRRQRVQNPKA